MFEHRLFRKYAFADVPLDQDIFLMDTKWMAEYETAMEGMFHGGKYPVVGYISYAAVRSIGSTAMELSWYPNIHTRFHEMRIVLPRKHFVTCVDCYDYDEKPHLFVDGDWLTSIHLRAHSVFAIVDAVGVKEALVAGKLTRAALVKLRQRIDRIAKKYPSISFVSFADSLLLKSNWFVGQYDSHIKYSYKPEIFIKVLGDIQKAYQAILGMPIYAVLAQGSNEYYDDALLHISPSGNHVSLNSLGLPFAQLRSIEDAARKAIREGTHAPAELYMDEDFYRSLNFVYEFSKNKNEQSQAQYWPPMATGPSSYFYSTYENIKNNLQTKRKK